MKDLVFSVFDDKVGLYMPPFNASAIGQASRMFEDAVNNRDGAMFKHPGDYKLFHLGYFDSGSGQFINLDNPSLVRVGTDCIESLGARVARIGDNNGS